MDQPLVDVAPNEVERLFFQIARRCAVARLRSLAPLAVDDELRLRRGGGAPHLTEGVHIERQVEELAVVVGKRRVDKRRDIGQAVHEVPYLAVMGMEDVRPVGMDFDAADVLAINVATEVRTPLYDETTVSVARSLIGEGGSCEAGAYNEEVVHQL